MELPKLVSKYLGFDQLVERVLSQLGDPQVAYVIGYYVNGLETGVINSKMWTRLCDQLRPKRE